MEKIDWTKEQRLQAIASALSKVITYHETVMLLPGNSILHVEAAYLAAISSTEFLNVNLHNFEEYDITP